MTEPKFRFLKGVPLDAPEYPHGTQRGYRYCKCEKCRAANAAYKAPCNTRQRTDEWKARQRELNRQYNKTEAGRGKRRALNALRKAKMKKADCDDASRLVIEAIYRHCPPGYDVDHIAPLARGGLHHPSNLQYLPSEVNNAKRAKVDFDTSAHAIPWQTLVEPSTTIPQGSRAKRPEVPSTPQG